MHTALVTGAASGIGRALAAALLARGSTVVVADLDGAAAERTAHQLGPRALAAQVDVRDREAVRALVERTDRDHDGLDLLMRARGAGQICSTSSLSGLIPAPSLGPYTTSKFAVVGLSLALRAEAAQSGVRVSVLCPGFTDTPLLDSGGMPEAAGTMTTVRPLIRASRVGVVPPELVARDCLAGLRRDRAVIVTPLSARVAWRAYRLAPGLLDRVARRTAREVLAELPGPAARVA